MSSGASVGDRRLSPCTVRERRSSGQVRYGYGVICKSFCGDSFYVESKRLIRSTGEQRRMWGDITVVESMIPESDFGCRDGDSWGVGLRNLLINICINRPFHISPGL